MKHRLPLFAALFAWSTALMLLAQPAQAIGLDKVSLTFGTEDDRGNVNSYGISTGWDWDVKWFKTGQWYLTTYSEFGLNVWNSDQSHSGTNDTLVNGYVMQVLRWQRDLSTTLPVFIEAGSSLNGYSHTNIDNQDFSIPFAFGTSFGAGIRFGPAREYQVLYRFQHQSNAGLGDDNPGIQFHLISLGYRF